MRDTKAVAAKILEALKRDSRKQFAESISDKQRKRKLLAELEQVLRGKL